MPLCVSISPRTVTFDYTHRAYPVPSVPPHCRAKLGYGLLSGEYSKPAPDPGDDNGTAEPRVGPDAIITTPLSPFSCDAFRGIKGCDSGEQNCTRVTLSLMLVFLPGGPGGHRSTHVQSPDRTGPRRVLHQPAAGRPGVFIALHKHGGGEVRPACCFTP